MTQDAESMVLRAVFQRAASVGNVVAYCESGNWYMQIESVRITDYERDILTRIAVAAP